MFTNCSALSRTGCGLQLHMQGTLPLGSRDRADSCWRTTEPDNHTLHATQKRNLTPLVMAWATFGTISSIESVAVI